MDLCGISCLRKACAAAGILPCLMRSTPAEAPAGAAFGVTSGGGGETIGGVLIGGCFFGAGITTGAGAGGGGVFSGSGCNSRVGSAFFGVIFLVSFKELGRGEK